MPEQVTIVSVTEIPTSPRPGVFEILRAITYQPLNGPPRTVFVPRDQDTQEERVRLIKADLEAHRAAPQVLDLP